MENEFKDTEIGKIPVDWNVATFSEIIDINPKRTLKKGEKYKKIAMTDIKEYTRKIQSYSDEEYKGGSRFTNEDTLFARITPCLENGKTAFVDILNENEIAFGSTEFIVLCGKEGITDSKYVYYLSISPEIRKKTIKSMIGTSGRQRVPNEVFGSIEIPLPPLSEQQKIAQILSALDDKIENNNQQNKILEETANSIFKEWFVDFNFLDENGLPYFENGGKMEFNEELGIEIPKGWSVKSIGEVSKFYKGLSYKSDGFSEDGIPMINLKCFERNGGFRHDGIKYYGGPYKKSHMVKKGDLVIAMTDVTQNADVIGNPAIVPETGSEINIMSLDVGKVETDEKLVSIGFLYGVFSSYHYLNFIKNYTTGTTVLHLNKDGIMNYEFPMPPQNLILEYTEIFNNIYGKISKNNLENQYLSNLRDLLLPKLMSGEIRLK
ncbi:type I restriction enzyme S subunit [Methanococcus maripaludis]|uniref:Type I restriction enzyme S subunit n=1 Tax=Methanococcus maripaludis TaxID=39152 RepID=A0A7J9P3D7_METMI|nr:restriction endonuclease subunit S [Methanococcus maripaludis]MBA2853944.1 type I restriction enzyme S subunit [Methanococcus maripaludis]